MTRELPASPSLSEEAAHVGPEQSGPILTDEERERLICAYWQIIALEPQRERKRLAQTRMGELIMQRPKAVVDAMETKLFGRPLR